LSGVLAALWLFMAPAWGTTPKTLQKAAAAYREGRVLDAEGMLDTALPAAANAQERWALANLLGDICSYSFDYGCIDTHLKTFQDAATALNQPQATVAKLVFLVAFHEYLRGDLDFFRRNGGLDFSLRIANPLADPALATRLFLLNAGVEEMTGDFTAAHRFIDRAFASFLRIDSGKDAFETATLMKELIDATLANHDAARAVRWALVADPVIRSGLSSTSFDYADYLRVSAQIAEILAGTGAPALQAVDNAVAATAKLEIAPELKEGLVSALAINQAAIRGLRGDLPAMRERLQASPYFARRDEIIERGAFSSLNELNFAAAELFFDALSKRSPDQRWRPLFEHVPDWPLGVDNASQAHVYTKVALALLTATGDVDAARRMFKDAAREELTQFERGAQDRKAFPLPSLLDRMVLTIAVGMMPPRPEGADADLMLASLEVLGRNPRYVISDTLAQLAVQQSDEERHAAHAVLRLSDRQADWEVARLKELVRRMAAHEEFPSKDFSSQLAAMAFSDSLARLSRGVRPSPQRLPTGAELQSALRPDEAFLAFVQGIRVCVRKNGVWDSRMAVDATQLTLDVKLLSAALSAQNPASPQADSQYPAEAALRFYHLVFDDLGTCLDGAKELVYVPPADLAAIPLSALLREAPPRKAGGYDLANAHWLILDYAFSTAASIRDFLSARKLSARSAAALSFAGLGDPKLDRGLDGPEAAALKDLPALPETRNEVEMIAKLFPQGADLRLGARATEENFRALPLEQYQVLHFATHGLLRDDIEGLSEAALVFTPVNLRDYLDDGLLTTSDIANLNLAARLIVLSACNTANFDPQIFTSPLQGLASAFAAAGAPTTVASLWSVDSQTGMRLMVHFYRALLSKNGPDVAMALRQAMIETLKEAPSVAFANPRFWAPFVVLGDGGVRLQAPRAPPSYGSAVEIAPGGGEILSMIADARGLTGSEIGAPLAGRYSSLIRARPVGAAPGWSVQDREIGAGPIAQWKDVRYAGGYVSRDKAAPVVRAFSAGGKLLWRRDLPSRFESASVMALTAEADGLYVLLAPLSAPPGKIDFDIVRLDAQGRKLSRRAMTAPLPGQSLLAGTEYALALADAHLYAAVSYPATSAKANRSDFGFPMICYEGAGAHVFKMRASDLAPQRDADLPGLSLHHLTPAQDGLSFAGAAHEVCAAGGETPLLGLLDGDLKPQTLWRDDGAFYGHLVSVLPAQDGYIAVGEITEPLDIRTPSPAEASQQNATEKHLTYLDGGVSEAVLMRFDRAGRVQEKRVLGNGLPQFAMGLVAMGKGGYAIYGSDGFNPWIETIN